MQVKLLVSRAGANFSQSRGEIVEVSDAEALRMVDAGQAELIRAVAPERAVSRSKPEKASK